MPIKGLPANSSVFMAGHSVGGAALQQFSGVHGHNVSSVAAGKVYRGQVLHGAFVTHKWRDADTQLLAANYSTPTLTIGGELDGNCRVSRIIEQFYIQNVKSRQPGALFVKNETLRDIPVVVVPGMSHMQFASGKPPPNVLDKVYIVRVVCFEKRFCNSGS